MSTGDISSENLISSLVSSPSIPSLFCFNERTSGGIARISIVVWYTFVLYPQPSIILPTSIGTFSPVVRGVGNLQRSVL